MFLVSKDGSSIIEVKQVDMRFEYDKATKRDAVEKVEEFLQGKNPPCKIIVNDSWNYGTYDGVQGKIVFEEIVNALKNESAYFDMREVDFGGIDNAD